MDRTEQYKSEYQADGAYAQMGVSEEDFIYSRQVDDGEAVLEPRALSETSQKAKPAAENWLASGLPDADGEDE
jgi:hypothetical protein